MGLLPIHEIPNDLGEVGDVAGDEASALARGAAELIEIETPPVPGLMRADGIQSALAQQGRHPGERSSSRYSFTQCLGTQAICTRPG